MNKKIFVIAAIGLVLLSSLVVFPVSSSSIETTSNGITIYVDDDNLDGPWDGTEEHPYQYIKDGIDAADDGDTVFVKEGIYIERFEIFKEINLYGENREKTIIKPSSNQKSVIVVYSDNVNIKEFQIQDGLQAISIRGNSITVEDNIFKNNICGIYVKDFNSFNNFKNNLFIGNYEGVHLNDASNNTVIFNNFTESTIGIKIVGDYNKIGNNIFFKNSYGIILANPDFDVSYKNEIKYNNFIDNEIPAYDYFDIHRFIKGFNNWYGNYWDRPRFFPKFIPQFSVDWHPALKPNDVGGVD